MQICKLLFIAFGALTAANAALIEVAGSASGTFGSTGASSTTAGSSTLTYFGSTFTGFLAPDLSTSDPYDFILGIGNVATPPANIDNFGSFTVTPNGVGGSSYNDTFNLVLTFALPPFASGQNPITYNAAVSGTVFTNSVGGVTFNFPSAINLPNFQNAYSFVAPLCAVPVPGCVGPLVPGSLNVSLNDVSITSGATSAVTGTLQAQTQIVPEPGTYALMGVGLLVLGCRRFRVR